MIDKNDKNSVGIPERPFITPKEAAAYFGIGINTIRLFANQHEETVLWVGKKMMIKRRRMEKLLDAMYEIDTPDTDERDEDKI